jgi:hypothetical protein
VESCGKRRHGAADLSPNVRGGLVRMGGETNVRGPAMRACSACAGDYEDPEGTARVEDQAFETGDDDGEESRAEAREVEDFPVREE